MTSVVNGKVHKEDVKNESDTKQIILPNDSKSCLKGENEVIDNGTKTKLLETSENQNKKDQSCVESLSEPKKEVNSTSSNDLVSPVKSHVEFSKENGILSSNLDDKKPSSSSIEVEPSCSTMEIKVEEKSSEGSEEIEMVEESYSSNAKEISSESSEEIEMIEDSSSSNAKENCIHDSNSKLNKEVRNSLSENENKKTNLQDESLSELVSEALNKNDSVVECKSKTNEQKEKLIVTLEESSGTTFNELSKNNNEQLSVTTTVSSSESTNTIISGTLDLSAPKDKDSVKNSLVNGDKNGFVEPNPLEKLNEHLNSIGCDETPKCSQNSHQRSTTVKLLSPKSDHPSSNKENKNIMAHAHDRFKDSPDNFVFAELSNEETGFPEVFSGLVKIGRYISVKGDFTLRSTEALVESPSLVSSYLLKEPDTFPPKEKDSKSETKDFFHTSAGEILIGIGLSRVNEWYHKDMVRIKKRQMKREGKRPQTEEELAIHEKSYTEARKANNVYSCEYKVCKTCGFTTESSVVMEGHLLVPHLTPRKEYQCNFCEVINRDPKLMLEHMEQIHKKIGRIQPPVLFFECPYCTFESNSKVKLNNHLAKCQRYFDHGVNQAPPRDFEFPALTPKPITVAVVKAYEKSLGSMHRGRGRPKKHENTADSMAMNQSSPVIGHSPNTLNSLSNFNSRSIPLNESSLGIHNPIMSPMQMSNLNIRPAHSNSTSQIRSNISPMVQTPNRVYQVLNAAGQVVPVVGNNQMATTPNQFSFVSNITSSGKKLPMPNTGPFFNSSPFGSGVQQQNLIKNMPDVNALPKMTGPYPSPAAKQTNQPGSLTINVNNLVVCEICDGYIKDLDQLRTHMQLIHKVKIHPKMLVSRPPLNCQKCQWRFFTDQGLERHLLGAHGLVTSNMQELANKNKDAGCCTICGRVYASKLVSHMNQVHKVTLKPAHLSYKCTVCSATFNLYRLFENHVYLVHSGAAKRSSEGDRSSPSKKSKTNLDSEKSSAEGEQRHHRDKKQSKEILEEIRICVECGDDVYSINPDCKKCEKCLKSDELVQGTLNSKANHDELKKNKTLKKAAS